MSLTQPALVIFDCDGVLIDSEAIYSRIDAEELNNIGVAITPEELLRRFTGMPLSDMYRDIERDFGVTLDDAFKTRIDTRVHAALQTELKAIAGIEQVLTALPQAKCVASSTGITSLHQNLQTAALHHHFDPHIYSAEMVTRGKPAPDLFLHVLQEMTMSAGQSVVIEDSVAGVTAATAAGITTIGFTGASHADSELGMRLKAAGAHDVIDHHAKLLPVLGLA